MPGFGDVGGLRGEYDASGHPRRPRVAPEADSRGKSLAPYVMVLTCNPNLRTHRAARANVAAMPRDRSRCPSCGERVSPYAAGCAVCGADLDPSRWDTGPTAGNRVASALNALSFGGLSANMKFLLIGFALVFFGIPILSVLL